MAEVFTWVVVALSLALAVWAAYRAVRDRPVVLRQLLAGGVVEAAIVVEMVALGIAQARGAAVADPVTLWGYLVTMLVVLPVAAAWAFVERSRWSSVVLLVACVTVAFLQWRVLVLWQA